MADIDINDPSLVNEPVETDSVSGEDYFSVRLPDDGDHNVRVALGTKGVTAGRQSAEKGGRPFITAYLAMTIYDENGERQGMIFDQPNSATFERNGKRTSKLHAVMDLLDAPFPNSATVPAQAEIVTQALAEEPALIAVTQWEASCKAETEDEVEKAIAAGYAKAGKLATGQHYTILKGQKKFPPLANNEGWDPEVENPITGEKVRARATVVRYKRA